MSLSISRKLVAASTLVLALAGCTDLSTQPKSTITTANIFNDPNSYTAFLAKLYGSLSLTGQNSTFSLADIDRIDEGSSGMFRLLWNLQELPTDEAAIAWNDGTILTLDTQTWTPNSEWVTSMFARLYFQIDLANEYLRQTTAAKISSRGQSGNATLMANLKQYRAEARFIRALSYYYAIDLYGDVPLVDENSPVGSTPPQQATRTQVYSFVEAELKAIRDSLPPSGPTPQYYGRATKAAADMLLAHLYLNAKVYTGTAQYDLARQYAESVIVKGGYSLAENWQDNFLADNHTSPEMIFPITADGQHQRSYSNLTTIMHAQVGPGMDAAAYGLNSGWWGLRTRAQFANMLESSPSGDQRAAILVKDSHTLHVTALTDVSTGYGFGKYKNVTKSGQPGSDQLFVDTDFPLFRLADAYLIYAEAVVRGGGGSMGTAVNYINLLRRRAYGNTSGNISSGDLTVQFIIDERGRELSWEAWRRSDLIRFGQFTGGSYIWDFKGGTPGGAATDSHLDLYPIPATELQANPKLKQNPGYGS